MILDITSYIESLQDGPGAGGYVDAGLIIKLGQTEEAATRSFYTKKFLLEVQNTFPETLRRGSLGLFIAR